MRHERFGPYQVFECVGTGGMATVHRATIDLGTGTREVALKRLLPELQADAAFVRDFIRESTLASQLDHPNIVRVHDVGCIGGIHYIAMELLRGASLMKLMRRSKDLGLPVPIRVVVAIVIELARALEYAQSGLDPRAKPFDLIHRDISPSNVFVTEAGQTKVIDFGVAKTLTGRFATQSGLAKGKLGYMSTEAIAAESVDARADLFSVGVVAWELIVGQRLFPVTDDWLPPRHDEVRSPSDLAPRCPRALGAIVLRALAADRGHRWPTAAALRTALEDTTRGVPPPATPREVAEWAAALLGPARPSTSRLSTADLVEEIAVDPALVFDDARTLEAVAVDRRFDTTPFDSDDRSALGEASPFVGDEEPAVAAVVRAARVRARVSFEHEPSEPSKEILVTPTAPPLPPPPRNQFPLESSNEILVTPNIDTGATKPYALPSPEDRAFPPEPTTRALRDQAPKRRRRRTSRTR